MLNNKSVLDSNHIKMELFFYLTIPFDHNLSVYCLSLNHKLNGFFHERNAKRIRGEKEYFIIKTHKCCHQVHYQNEITIIIEILIEEIKPSFRMKKS